MIKNNLSLLLTERNLKITKVANDTKISRTTLTSLNQNENKMIQMDTINTLCKYLKITPGDFFEYSPIDVSFYFEVGESVTSQNELNKGVPLMISTTGFINLTKFDEKIGSIEFSGLMIDQGPIEYINNEKYIYGFNVKLTPDQDMHVWDDLISISFQTQIKKDFENYIKKQLEEDSEVDNGSADKYEYSVSVSFEHIEPPKFN